MSVQNLVESESPAPQMCEDVLSLRTGIYLRKLPDIRLFHREGRSFCHQVFFRMYSSLALEVHNRLSIDSLGFMSVDIIKKLQGRIQGGGVLGVRTPPPPFWGTPKLHKEGKNVARVPAKMPHFSTKQLPGPPTLQNPVSAPAETPVRVYSVFIHSKHSHLLTHRVR